MMRIRAMKSSAVADSLLLLILLTLSLTSSQAWVVVVPNNNINNNSLNNRSSSTRRTISSSLNSSTSITQLAALPAAAASLLAGSIAGSVGVGVAFPLDTIKTKAQVLATSTRSHRQATCVRGWDSNNSVNANANSNASTRIAMTAIAMTATPNIVSVSASGIATVSPSLATITTTAGATSTSTTATTTITNNNSMIAVAQYIYQQEGGLAGFFGGVQTSMVGQAIIKAIVFAVNAAVLGYCQDHAILQEQPALQLLTAAATAGFVTSFFAAPVDRIKVLMQADAGQRDYDGKEDAAIQAVLKTEGWKGLMGRGLACTVVREVPAYSLYFTVYGALQAWTVVTEQLGPTLAPLLYGAAAGCACWIPIYPIDVIKTVIQNSKGGDEEKSPWQVATELYEMHGLKVFWDGIAPRLLRQAVNHAVTFSVYDALMHQWTATATATATAVGVQ